MRARLPVCLASAAVAAALGTGCDLSLELEKPESIPPPPSRDTPDTGRVGDAITVEGEETELKARLDRVLDPAPTQAPDRPLRPGGRFVGIELTLKNIGAGRYDASPLGDANLLTDRGEADPTTLFYGPCSRAFASHLALARGEQASGCLVFEVAPGAKPTEFHYALDSGFAPERGTWKLK